ncbi:unnamed protein product [Gongylonema pulchrum]|uniref:Uncharacterized protein n=1 Tax=Gongylonema pulchrum TaxID=637853 RepID=A0A183EYQ3_9BILA|nr:unnamed protein product [Gongylonema pulchrum]
MPLAELKFVVSCSDSERGFGAENLLGQGKSGRTKWRGKAGKRPFHSLPLYIFVNRTH